VGFGVGCHGPERNDMTGVNRSPDWAALAAGGAVSVQINQIGTAVLLLINRSVF